MRVATAEQAKTETFALWGGGGRGDECRHGSPGTGLAYGLRRVCAAWGMARSSFYAMTSGQHAKQPPAKRRGPKLRDLPDQALLVAIEADLEASPWEGEGYRKVRNGARFGSGRDIRVGKRMCSACSMRDLQSALAGHRCVAAVAAIPMCMTGDHLPRSCGAPMAFG